ncbi:amidase [Alkalihalophilus pseudofirmus]|nr:amidase [Alkalihalophilus pseudofirmus]
MFHWNAMNRENLNIKVANEGQLKELTFAVKDVFDIKDLVAGAGNPDWQRTHGRATKHAEVVQRLLEEGATLKGTTHTDELMFSLNGENVHYGTPVNPSDPTRIPGGSSSGSAVSVAASLVDFAIGTDTGGSVRIPSSYCGNYGIRPTHGAVSTEGLIPLASQFDTVGWMTKSAELLFEVGQVLLDQPETKKRFTKLIIPQDIISMMPTECKDIFLKQVEWWKNQYEHVDTQVIAPDGIQEWLNAFRTLQGYEIWQTHGEWISEVNPTFGPDIDQRFKWASTIKEDDVHLAKQKKEDYRKQILELLGEDGLILMPTAPGIAPKVGKQGKELEEQRVKTLQMTCISGLVGCPQISLPLLQIDDLPVGLSVLAGREQDLRLLHEVKFCTDQLSLVGYE